jgi:hypothetical protein
MISEFTCSSLRQKQSQASLFFRGSCSLNFFGVHDLFTQKLFLAVNYQHLSRY